MSTTESLAVEEDTKPCDGSTQSSTSSDIAVRTNGPSPRASGPSPRNSGPPSPRAGSEERGAPEERRAGRTATSSTASGSSKSPRRDPQSDGVAVHNLTRQADLLASRARFDEALALVNEALRLEPQRAELHLGKGQCFMQLGKEDEAIRCFEAALQRDPLFECALQSKVAVLVKLQRWEDAAASLQEMLAAKPGNTEMQSELARCLTERGIQLKTAGLPRPELFHDALKACKRCWAACFQLGVEYSEAGDNAHAKEMYAEAVRLNPGYVEAWNNLGVACRALGELDNAVQAYSMALKSNQNCKKTHENMAICLLELGCRHIQEKDLKKASAMLKQALVHNIKNADIYFNLGVMYAEAQKWEKAKVQYELATHFDPGHADAHNNLGVIYRRLGNWEAAIQSFEKALQANPKMTLANKNLGAAFGPTGRMAESIRLTQLALESNPGDAEAYNNLALLHRDQGDVDTCLEHLESCLKLEPTNRHACSNRLMTLNYKSDISPEEVFDAHRSYGEELEKRTPVQYTSWNTLSAQDGLLRIGYISPDLYRHSVSYFIHAALRHHDPAYVHVTCYSDVAVEDDKTQLFRSLVPRWRQVHGLPDEEVARMIHDDGIDILVELAGHTGNNRLPMLALRPAPIIVTWIGYPHTTGLTRADYRISDACVDPVDAPGLTTEKLVYLPECFLCYTPPDGAPAPALRPAQETYGCITFGCFNTLAKVSPITVRLWGRLLREVPESRLFLKSKALQCSEVQEKFRMAFQSLGIEAHRVDLSGLQAHTGNHLSMYNLVDVALDTAPYAGTTTTCEALYMGVPIVTLRGRGIHAQNVGASLLSAVDLGDLVANTEDEYVQKASSLAHNLTRLGALRAGLRTRMLRSVLCDGPRHTARLERLYATLAARTPSTSPSRGVSSSVVAQEEAALA